jgi:hypothetical protein
MRRHASIEGMSALGGVAEDCLLHRIETSQLHSQDSLSFLARHDFIQATDHIIVRSGDVDVHGGRNSAEAMALHTIFQRFRSPFPQPQHPHCRMNEASDGVAPAGGDGLGWHGQ